MTTDKIRNYWVALWPWALAIVLVGTMWLCLALVHPAGAHADVRPVECIAHRGGTGTGHTEETNVVYTASMDAGVPEVEGDVRFTSTGYPMLNHDADLTQFGAPTLALSSLTQTQAQSHTSASGDTMLSLWGLRTLLLSHPGTRLQVEMKETMTTAKWDMIDSRLAVVRDQVTITSFSLTTVRQAEDRGYRSAWLLAAPSSSTAAEVDVQDYTTITAAHVAALIAVGVSTQAYTPDSPADWTALAADGISALVTDDYSGCMVWEADRI
jgi:glycerophosphoryl diester phosphodiesterase